MLATIKNHALNYFEFNLTTEHKHTRHYQNPLTS